MQKTANAIALVATMLVGAASAQGPHIAQPLLAAATEAQAAAAPTVSPRTNASLISDLLRIEMQRAIDEAKKGESAAAPQPTASTPALSEPAKAGGRPKGASFNEDVVELLGVYQRGSTTAADVAINGVVYLMSPGDEILGYQITGVGGNCVHLRDVNKQKLTRCVLGK